MDREASRQDTQAGRWTPAVVIAVVAAVAAVLSILASVYTRSAAIRFDEKYYFALAKGIASGMPLGGFISSHELMDVFRDPPLAHCSTFGGNPVCCAAAVATIKVIEEENLLQNARDRGAEPMAGMEGLKEKYPDLIKEIRGRGLLTALELKRDEDTAALAAKVKDLGATVSWTMNAGATVRVSPPLVITKDQIGQALDIFDKACASLNM